jgi:hypothetical protein
MFVFIILAGVAHYAGSGHSTPMEIGIMLGIGLIIWIFGKLFSKD